ncbi:MAG: hypothetical protein ABIU29_02765 [Chthoniobacterales bacterium]
MVEEMRTVLLLAATREVAHKTGAAGSGILVSAGSIKWFPWVGTLGLRTLALHAAASSIPHDVDSLSITYKTDSIVQPGWKLPRTSERQSISLASCRSSV